MKKILAFLLAAVMLFALCACGSSEEKKDDAKTPATTKAPANNEGEGDNNDGSPKFGSALYVTNVSATDADEANNGKGTMDVTAAAVIIDGEGKIVACDLDTMQNAVAFTIDGKAIANDGFKTKYEQGDEYGMKGPYGSATEWYEHADAFKSVVIGKTIAEVKALMVAETNKGNEEVEAAGCTIKINEFVAVLEKAVANAKTVVDATAAVKVTLHTEQTCTDATAEKNGSNKVSTYVFAAALKDGKVVTADSDCVEAEFKFDDMGFVDFDTAKEIKSKREQGDSYQMTNYETGYKSSWAQQADAFDAQCEGKTGAEIANLIKEDGKGVDAVYNAGCTITVSGMVAVASKI